MNLRKPIIFALLYFSGSKISKYLKEIEIADNFDVDEKKKYQQEKLKKMLWHAYENVPYYKRILKDAGVIAGDKIKLENFKKIPILTKDIIRRERDNLYSKDYKKRKSYKNTSGGSTGEPVAFVQDKNYDDWNIATKIYFNRMFGKNIGEKELKLWGSDRDIIKGSLTVKDRIINFLYNREFFNCYNFDKGNIKKLIELNNKFKPKAYWSYVEAANELAKYIEQTNANFVSPKFIITTIGPLYSKTRKMINKTLKCKVYNQYGSREIGWVAVEKVENEELHTCFWRNISELHEYSDTHEAEEKKLILTTLDNYSMPLIRYEIGDSAIAGKQQMPLANNVFSYLTINNVVGRTLGFFKKRNGSLKHTHFLVQQMFFKNWIQQFQIIQKDYNLVLCRIVGEKNEKGMMKIQKLFRTFLGDDITIKWEFIDEIQPSKSGKYLYTICEVK